MHRVAAAAVLVAGILSSVPVPAAEISGRGEAVIARVERPEGDRFEITVTPPPDRGVDRRVMEWLTDTGVEAGSAQAGGDDPVDIGGYRMRVERVASADCSAQFSIRSKPANLAPKKAFIVESDSATHMSAVAFPTKGDVDVYIFGGNNGDVCDSSTRKKQNMDAAGCTYKMCQLLAGIPHLEADVVNLTTAQATAVANVTLVFVSVP